MATTPEDRTTFLSDFCAKGPRPNVMTGLMRLLLIEHFSNADNLEIPFKDRLFVQNADNTGILIEDALVWTPGRTEKRPAVIIKRNDWDSIKKGTFDSSTGTTTEGFRTYTKYWQGSHTLFALAKEGNEAELLGAEVYRFLLHLGPQYRKWFNLMTFELVKLGAVHRVEEAKDHYAVPITIAYAWAESWVIRETAPKMKTISLSELYNFKIS